MKIWINKNVNWTQLAACEQKNYDFYLVKPAEERVLEHTVGWSNSSKNKNIIICC